MFPGTHNKGSFEMQNITKSDAVTWLFFLIYLSLVAIPVNFIGKTHHTYAIFFLLGWIGSFLCFIVMTQLCSVILKRLEKSETP
ncbi:hypothetical protein V7O66_08015 [Methanolobus sp. ZRKC3]|uniref:hypothetical protein n=1 Tax=Methanolobus sp. ZRKC3 TaxID=3125786 RepID=UPI0032505567